MAHIDPTTNTILFVGPTGCGKGTQARLLSEKTGYPVFSTGGRYRELREGKTDLAKRVREDYDKGLLMPPWFSTFLFQELMLYLPFASGSIHESTGKTLFEAQQFDATMAWLGRPYVVFNISISDEESLKRQRIRAEVEHRPDGDTEEKLKVRLAEFQNKTVPAIDFFREKGKVIDIDGERSVEEIHADILKHLQLE